MSHREDNDSGPGKSLVTLLFEYFSYPGPDQTEEDDVSF